jgi:hypothetical protein
LNRLKCLELEKLLVAAKGTDHPTAAKRERKNHVHILEMNGDSYRLDQSKRRARPASSDTAANNPTQA